MYFGPHTDTCVPCVFLSYIIITVSDLKGPTGTTLKGDITQELSLQIYYGGMHVAMA